MNFAEGKGPKQVKKQWPLGPMTSIYGNMGLAYNPPTTPYPRQFTQASGTLISNVGGQITNVTYVSGFDYVSNVAVPGSLVPGLNLNINGNDVFDISAVCSPGSNESVQDSQSVSVTLWPEQGWSGYSVVSFQGTANRYYDNDEYNGATGWNTIGTIQVGSGNTTYTMTFSAASGTYNAYRLTASGGTGIIDWAITGMFVDLSANKVGANATDANGHIGQMHIQYPRVISISGGNYIENGEDAEYLVYPTPYENLRAVEQTIIP